LSFFLASNSPSPSRHVRLLRSTGVRKVEIEVLCKLLQQCLTLKTINANLRKEDFSNSAFLLEMSNHPTLESTFVECLPPFNDVEVKFPREQKPATLLDKIVCGHVGYLLDKDSTATDLLEWVKRGVRAERLIVDSMAEASVWMLPDALSHFKHLVHLRLESSCDSLLLPALLLLGQQLPHLRIRLNGKRHALLPSLVQLSLQDACPSATMPPSTVWTSANLQNGDTKTKGHL